MSPAASRITSRTDTTSPYPVWMVCGPGLSARGIHRLDREHSLPQQPHRFGAVRHGLDQQALARAAAQRRDLSRQRRRALEQALDLCGGTSH
ncbi:hypothetical protein ADK90_14350 [Streptomyces sp. XY413]|nr:hypothetical protein ADK90_14350 [Streptomyces sp. XY413]